MVQAVVGSSPIAHPSNEMSRIAGLFFIDGEVGGWARGAVVPLGRSLAAGRFFPSLPRRGQDGGACRRAVKVGPPACAARTADAAPLTAHRSRAVLCPGRGRERGRQAVFAVAISPTGKLAAASYGLLDSHPKPQSAPTVPVVHVQSERPPRTALAWPETRGAPVRPGGARSPGSWRSTREACSGCPQLGGRAIVLSGR